MDPVGVRVSRAAKPEPKPKPKHSPQRAARAKLEKLHEQIVDKTRAMARLATSIRTLQRRAAYYEKRAAMTDEALAAERESKRAAAERRKATSTRRGIRVTGEL